jgi:hypothetical protein
MRKWKFIGLRSGDRGVQFCIKNMGYERKMDTRDAVLSEFSMLQNALMMPQFFVRLNFL